MPLFTIPISNRTGRLWIFLDGVPVPIWSSVPFWGFTEQVLIEFPSAAKYTRYVEKLYEAKIMTSTAGGYAVPTLGSSLCLWSVWFW